MSQLHLWRRRFSSSLLAAFGVSGRRPSRSFATSRHLFLELLEDRSQPNAATHFVISAPSSSSAGSVFSATVTALDQFNNVATGYTGTVHFTETDSGAGSVIPANYTFAAGDSGVHTFTSGVTFVTAGHQTVTATDTVTSSITGTSSTILVTAAAATHFTMSTPSSTTAGSPFSIMVTALDPFNNIATGYTGTVNFTCSDGAAVLPAGSPLSNGEGAFTAVLKTAGNQTITATVPGITGPSSTITVTAAVATHFTVVAPASATVGSPFNFTVTALDLFNNTATGYTGTAHFTSSDGAAVLPGNSTLSSGVGTFSATLNTSGGQTITATDTSSIVGTSGGIAVSTATHFAITAPAGLTAGSAFSVTVTALDSHGNTATDYRGTIHFTSTDGGVGSVLPADYTFTAADNGVHTFTGGVTLVTAGNQTVTATDTVNASIIGTGTVAVTAAAATHFTVSAPSSLTAGLPFSITVTALDLFNNVATGYTNTVGFTSSDGAAVLPGNSNLIGGIGNFSVILKTAGNQTITAMGPAISGTSNTIAVNAAAATHFTVSVPAGFTAGSTFSITVTALDLFNNVATGYTGTVGFTSSDGAAVLPGNSTLSNGTGTFSATLKTAGHQTVTATDTVTSSITGTSSTITVTAAAAHFTMSTPSSSTAGSPFNIMVTAFDPFNNIATAYMGTVGFTSSDGAAVLPIGNFIGGIGNFTAILKTAGSQTITAAGPGITGLSSTITVTAAVATHFTVSAPSNATMGSPFNFTVTALDLFNNTATGYTGTVHFTSSDGAAVLPGNSTLSSGVGTFSATLKTAGNQTITATDTSSIVGTSGGIAVSTATHFAVAVPSTATAGSAFSVTVTALDSHGNTATDYRGTIHFTSTDGGVGLVLPANYTFVAGDNGVHTFVVGVTLVTAGNQTITATDTATTSISGTGTIAVNAAAATHFTVIAPPTSTTDSAFNITVTALDQFGNVATGFTGAIQFTSTDTRSVLPVQAMLINGVGSFAVTLRSPGIQTLTATDSAASSVTGTSGAIVVSLPVLPLVVGSGFGEPDEVLVEGPAPGMTKSFRPFGGTFGGGVNVAAVDVNGDGVPDIVVGTATGSSHVEVFDGATDALLLSFFAFDGFRGGVNVAVGDVTGSGHDDIIVGAATGSSHVKVFDGATGALLLSFFAFDGFQGGVSVAAGDVNADGFADIITAAGTSDYSHVKVFGGPDATALLASFLTPPAFDGAVSVAAGDLFGDQHAEIIVTSGTDRLMITVYQGGTFAPLYSFAPYPGAANAPVRVGVASMGTDGKLDLVTIAAPPLPQHVKVFRGTDLSLLDSFIASN